jgi:hypothetical protein
MSQASVSELEELQSPIDTQHEDGTAENAGNAGDTDKQDKNTAPSENGLMAADITTLVSKRREKRVLEKRLTEKAVAIDKQMKASIDEAAAELGVAPAALRQQFALVVPEGEKRTPMWWNGLVAEKAKEWKAEYGAYQLIS